MSKPNPITNKELVELSIILNEFLFDNGLEVERTANLHVLNVLSNDRKNFKPYYKNRSITKVYDVAFKILHSKQYINYNSTIKEDITPIKDIIWEF